MWTYRYRVAAREDGGVADGADPMDWCESSSSKTCNQKLRKASAFAQARNS